MNYKTRVLYAPITTSHVENLREYQGIGFARGREEGVLIM